MFIASRSHRSRLLPGGTDLKEVKVSSNKGFCYSSSRISGAMATQTAALVQCNVAPPLCPGLRTRNSISSYNIHLQPNGFSSNGCGRGRSVRMLTLTPWSLKTACKSQALTDEFLSKTKKIGRFTAKDRVDILSEALPFIQRFHKKIVVVKYGGAAMKDLSLKDGVIKDLVLLSCVGLRPVLVHGGGPEINSWLGKLGIEPQFRNGLRVTDAETMEVVEMVLVGKVNKSLVSLINRAGGTAIGMSGKDGKLLTARPLGGDFGFVGEITNVDTSVVNDLLRDGHIPVVATVAADLDGQAYNINADIAAGEIAASLGAEKLILMTDVPGVMLDLKDKDTLVKSVDIKGIRKMITDGVIGGGMIPKVGCCVRSLAQGVKAAHIIDGREPHSLLLEILTDEGAGTMILG